jgi:hypothetical protein
MAEFTSIRNFLQHNKGQHGILLFMNERDKTAWLMRYGAILLEDGAQYSEGGGQFFGIAGSYLKLFVYIGELDARQRLRGYWFDRFWHEGEMPQHVGELVLERCI